LPLDSVCPPVGPKLSYTFDMCLVFTNTNTEESDRFLTVTGEYVHKLHKAGLETLLYYDVTRCSIYCLVGATEKRLHYESKRSNYDLQMNGEQVLKYASLKNLNIAQACLEPQDPKNYFIDKSFFKRFHGKWDERLDSKAMKALIGQKLKEDNFYPDFNFYELALYPRYHDDNDGVEHKNSVFRTIDRLILLYQIIEEREELLGANLDLITQLYESKSPLSAYFPMHQKEVIEALDVKWCRGIFTVLRTLFKKPLDDIRDYFGEKIAFYFAFLDFYNVWLALPALFGITFFILQTFYFPESYTETINICFGLVMTIWTSFFVAFWKQKQNMLMVEWGMHKFYEKEISRPAFKGKHIRSAVDGSIILYASIFWQRLRVCFTYLVVLILLGFTVLGIVGIYSTKTYWTDQIGLSNEYSGYVISSSSALWIIILDYILCYVAEYLTEIENHRTESEHENALILKHFCFKFVNYYWIFIYIAFVKNNVDTCTPDCMTELRVQLLFVFASNIFTNNVIEFLTPIFIRSWNRFWSPHGILIAHTKSRAEKEYELAESYMPLYDYSELVLQFGFVSLFSICSPYLGFLALINNFIESWYLTLVPEEFLFNLFTIVLLNL